MTILLAGLATFAFTTVLSIAGVGAAFILIPVFLSLGVDLRTAMATALLLNAVSMAAACVRFIRARLVDFPTAIPILAIAVPLAPLGAYTSRYLPVETLKGLFVGFLLFAATMMFFYRGRKRENACETTARRLAYGSGIGDTLSSVGVVVGAAVMAWTGWYRADALISAGIGLVVLWGTGRILRDALRMLLEGTPPGLDAGEVSETIRPGGGGSDPPDAPVEPLLPHPRSLGPRRNISSPRLAAGGGTGSDPGGFAGGVQHRARHASAGVRVRMHTPQRHGVYA